MNVLCPPPFTSPYPSYSNFPSDFRSPQISHTSNEMTPEEGDNNNNNNAQEITGDPILEPVEDSPSPLPMIENKSFFQTNTCHETLRDSPNNYEVDAMIESIRNISCNYI